MATLLARASAVISDAGLLVVVRPSFGPTCPSTALPALDPLAA
jgi:hypothetical protein